MSTETSTATMRRRTSASSSSSSVPTYRRSRDPVTAVLIIIVACTTLVTPANAAPTPEAFNPDFDSWWYNACGHHGSGVVTPGARHSRHKDSCEDLGDTVPKSSKNKVRRQLFNFNKSFQKELAEINSTYSEVMNDFAPYTREAYEWLPKFHKPTKKSKTVLKTYHLELQKYAVAVHYLSRRKLNTEADILQNNRKQILANVLKHMKALLCEIETAVNDTCQEVPSRIPASFAREKGLSVHATSLTDLYLVDFGILSRFEVFMKHSKGLAKFLPVKGNSRANNSGKKKPNNKQTQQKKQQQNNKKATKQPKRHNSNNKKSKPPT